jgi:group I intron endonuclease
MTLEQQSSPSQAQENETTQQKRCICGIYRIKNLINQKVYIGSAINITRRWWEHKGQLNGNKHGNSYLQKSWNKHKSNSFVFEIIEEVAVLLGKLTQTQKLALKDNLLFWEQIYIDNYAAADRKYGYNIREHAGNTLGMKHSEETKQKLSEIQKRPEIIEKYKRIGKINGGYSWKGKHLSKEHKEKLRHVMNGNKKCAHYGEKNPMFGKPHSEEHNKKLSMSNKGKHYWTDEQKKKIGERARIINNTPEYKESNRRRNLGDKNPNYNKHPSEETLKKQSEASKRMWSRPEYRNKLSGANKIAWNKGQKMREECRQKMIGSIPWNKNKKMSEESCHKNSLSHMGKHPLEETKEKLRKTSEMWQQRKMIAEWT